MKIEIDFVLKNDPDGKLHDLIKQRFMDVYKWTEMDNGRGLTHYDEIFDNTKSALKYARELFISVTQYVAAAEGISLFFDKAVFSVDNHIEIDNAPYNPILNVRP